jgi:hypothetical protein
MMIKPVSRRLWLKSAPLGVCGAATVAAAPPPEGGVGENFPAHPPAMIREMVTVAHGNTKRVRELIEARPALANAAWDWGFGDWETAIGAASHVGDREIADLLLSRGAHPTIFSAAMLGQLEVVRAFIAARPGIQRTHGPHGISLMAHAKAGGKPAQAVLQYLEELGDADGPAAVEINEEELAKLKGDYVFGPGPDDRIEITLKGKQLTFTRKGATARPIHYVGDRAFRPAGAGAVRIRFAGEGAGTVLTVHDPGVILTAKRIAGE